jgi:hypothetical protein
MKYRGSSMATPSSRSSNGVPRVVINPGRAVSGESRKVAVVCSVDGDWSDLQYLETGLLQPAGRTVDEVVLGEEVRHRRRADLLLSLEHGHAAYGVW